MNLLNTFQLGVKEKNNKYEFIFPFRFVLTLMIIIGLAIPAFADNLPPYTPNNPFPSDGEMNVLPGDVTLEWTGGDPDAGDTITYDLFIEREEGFVKVAENISENSYLLTNIASKTIYSWKVTARDSSGLEVIGPLWTFSSSVESDFKAPISAGDNFSYGLKADGTVWAWGLNYSGQLGDGSSITERNIPIQVSTLSGIIAVTAGASHGLSLSSNGTVWSWGVNAAGQLGDGTTSMQTTPVQVSIITDIDAISAGDIHSLALKSDGTVWAWGHNGSGRLGDGTDEDKNEPVQVSNLSDVISIAGGGAHSLALKSDSTVWSWGGNSAGQLGDGTYENKSEPIQISGLSNVVAVACGESHSLALKSDGTVWSWGYNYYGQLGDGTNDTKNEPVQVSILSDVIAIACGENHSLALLSDGTVKAWGRNNWYQLGDWSDYNRSTPVDVSNIENVIEIAGGNTHSLAVTSDGIVWAWGRNLHGELGNGTSYEATMIPNKVLGLNGNGYLNLSVPNLYVYLPQFSTEGENVISGQAYISIEEAQSNDVTVSLTSGDVSEINVPSSITIPSGETFQFFNITVQDDSLLDGSQIVNITASSTGYVSGEGTTLVRDNETAELTVSLPAIVNEGDGLLIGNGTVTVSQTVDVDVKINLFSGDSSEITVPSFLIVQAGQNSANFDINVIDDDAIDGSQDFDILASVPGWTSGGSTIVVNDNEEKRISITIPEKLMEGVGTLENAGIVSIEGPYTSNLIINLSSDDLSEVIVPSNITMPNGETTVTFEITVIDDNEADGSQNVLISASADGWESGSGSTQVDEFIGSAKIAAAQYHTLALKNDGTVWAWGSNKYGWLGDGTNEDRSTPVQVSGLTIVTSIACGYYHNLALKADRTVWTWGNNGYGQLGDGTQEDKDSPTNISSLSNIMSVSGGGYHSLALKSDGTVWAWGRNSDGQLGDGTNEEKSNPVQVLGLSEIIAVSAGGYHSLALKSDGTVWAWGYNGYGRLGDGTDENMNEPVQVSNLSDVISIAGGGAHSLALKSDGTVWSWGFNLSGQLGDDTTQSKYSPVQAVNLTDVVAISGGDYHSLALRIDGTVLMWGNEEMGAP